MSTGVDCRENGNNTVLIALGIGHDIFAANLEPDEAREIAARLVALANEVDRMREGVTYPLLAIRAH